MISLHSLYDALVGINVPIDKARAVVDVLERDMLSHLATKSDLDALRRELRAEFALVRQESKSDIALLRQEVDSGLSSVRKDMDSGFATLRKDMDAGFLSSNIAQSSLRKDLEQAMALQRRDLTIWLGSVQIFGMGLLFAALKLA